jgi:hypothetical protein
LPTRVANFLRRGFHALDLATREHDVRAECCVEVRDAAADAAAAPRDEGNLAVEEVWAKYGRIHSFLGSTGVRTPVPGT